MHIEYRVLFKTNGTSPLVCSKTGFLKIAWHKKKMLPCLGPLGSYLPLIISFKMRYCMTLYFKGHQKYDMSKLKLLFSWRGAYAFCFYKHCSFQLIYLVRLSQFKRLHKHLYAIPHVYSLDPDLLPLAQKISHLAVAAIWRPWVPTKFSSEPNFQTKSR